MKKKSPAATYMYLIAACLASLIISTFASYFFYNKWNEAEDRAVEFRNEKNILSQQYSRVQNSLEKFINDMMVLRDENATVYTLDAVDSTKRYLARVYWNHYTRESYIDVLSLPVSDSSKQYQLWAFVGGLPVNAGVFSVNDETEIRHTKPVVSAESWAVSLEPKGGSLTPTPDQLYLRSKNSAPN